MSVFSTVVDDVRVVLVAQKIENLQICHVVDCIESIDIQIIANHRNLEYLQNKIEIITTASIFLRGASQS